MGPVEQAEQLYLARRSARAAIRYAAGLASDQGNAVTFSQAVRLFISALEAQTVRRLVGIEEQALDLICAVGKDRRRHLAWRDQEGRSLPSVAREPGPSRPGAGGHCSDPGLSRPSPEFWNA
ncbi:hypothetical protein DAERI_110091 [Deinococcus aerius]|uniref:Uncharacterized protein n=1 Tax=Deinococcus aerius TaxID=200253 RepID=A0A2I9CXS8_9DEIO|nr:hypothetical protein [Deinococcus aerius]GBF06909.1 hypothetical protein DAERI_110091 [Deinococcus aerius]